MSQSSIATGLGVHIKVRDIQESRRFYEDYLELVPVFAYGDEAFRAEMPEGLSSAPEAYRGVTYEFPGGAKLEIADGHIAVQDAEVFRSVIESPKISAMISVSSLGSLLNKSDIRPNSPVKHYYWGTLEMVVRDPDGWVVVLIAPFSEAEKTAISQHVQVVEVSP